MSNTNQIFSSQGLRSLRRGETDRNISLERRCAKPIKKRVWTQIIRISKQFPLYFRQPSYLRCDSFSILSVNFISGLRFRLLYLRCSVGQSNSSGMDTFQTTFGIHVGFCPFLFFRLFFHSLSDTRSYLQSFKETKNIWLYVGASEHVYFIVEYSNGIL